MGRKVFMRKKRILLLLIGMTQLLTGCWSRVEVNDLSIVTATAIDKLEDGNIRLTLQIAIPMMLGPIGTVGGGAGEKKATVIVSEKGETVLEANRRLQEKLPRKLFFSHSRIIIIGEKLARDGVSPLLDFFSRHRESRLRSFILIAKGEAADILKINPKWERVSAEEIRKAEIEKVGMSVYLNDFLNMLLAEGVEPVASQVQTKLSEVKNKSDSDNEESPAEKDMRVAISGTAVFHKDKLIGWMNDKETRGVVWLRNEVKTNTGVVTVDISTEKGKGKVSAQTLSGKMKIKPVWKDNKINIEVEGYAEDVLYENSTKLDLNNPEVIEFIQKKLEDEIKNRMQLALDKAQKQLKSDIFGFGTAVYRTYPKEWKKNLKEQWDQEFPKLEVKITPHVKLVRTGLTNNSLTWDEKELQK
jgi:spore germination protein KC